MVVRAGASCTTKGRGFGLISMRERLKLVAGELVIHSKPGSGTTIVACVPLPVLTECVATSGPRR